MMRLLIMCLACLTLNPQAAYTQTKQSANIQFIITQSGDSITTKSINKSRSNEDRIVYRQKGKTNMLAANQVDNYYQKGRVRSIYVSNIEQTKLVRFRLDGRIKLATSKSSKGNKHFYLYHDEKWEFIEPQTASIKRYLNDRLPNFIEVVGSKTIYYDLPGLGNALAKYNEHLDDSYQKVTAFKFKEVTKFGIYSAAGLGNFKMIDPESTFNNSAIYNLGLIIDLRFSRRFTGKLQATYQSGHWENRAWEIQLRNAIISPSLGYVVNPLYKRKLYVLVGLPVGFNLNSVFTDKDVIADPSKNPIGTGRLGFGYDIQLAGEITNKIEVFASYQYIRNSKSEEHPVLTASDRFISYSVNQFRIGLYYYLF